VRAAVAPHVHDDAHVLRTSLLAVAGLSIVGIVAELLIERHWGSLVRYVPWVCLAFMAWAVYAIARRPTGRVIRVARTLAVLVMAGAGLGIALHINENYTAAPLDFRYQDAWATMSEPQRWWAAFSKSVGPAPTFAPAALAEIGLLVLVATLRHPVLRHELR
jgi:hypothetical protein